MLLEWLTAMLCERDIQRTWTHFFAEHARMYQLIERQFGES